jgi:hypothetical protein
VRDEQRLVRLRSNPAPDDIASLQRDLGCPRLRAQVQRLFESYVTGPRSTAPVATAPAVAAPVDAAPKPSSPPQVQAQAAPTKDTIAAKHADGNLVRLSPGLFQPIAADDVSAIVADVALAAPRNGIVDIAGPERAPFNEIIARYLKAVGDPREVVCDPEARYWGGRVEARSLVPLGEARLGRIGFDEWLRRSKAAA